MIWNRAGYRGLRVTVSRTVARTADTRRTDTVLTRTVGGEIRTGNERVTIVRRIMAPPFVYWLPNQGDRLAVSPNGRQGTAGPTARRPCHRPRRACPKAKPALKAEQI